MRKFTKLDEHKKAIIKQYEDGISPTTLAETYSVGERTVYSFLAQLRRKGEIGQRKYATQSKVLDNKIYQTQVNNDEDITEQELLKLLSIYKTRTKVGKALGVSTRKVTQLCEHYQIRDLEYMSKKINETLKNLCAGFEAYPVIKKKKNEEGDTLIIHITDTHAGKVIKEQDGSIKYNSQICKERMDKLLQQILKLLDNNIVKGVKISDVVIISTGDLANGENIYATQAYEQEIAPPKQVMLMVEVLMKLILSLVERKLDVKFYGVKGNHGRTGKDSDPSANWDLMIYMLLDREVRVRKLAKQVQIKYAETDYMVFEVRGHGCLIRHKAPEQSDSPSGRVKFNEWARQHNVESIIYGHFHHYGNFDCDGVRIFRGGSVPGGDDLSESMAKDSDPIQLVWGVNDRRVMTFFYAVDLASD